MTDKSWYVAPHNPDKIVWETKTHRLHYYSGICYSLEQFSPETGKWFSVATTMRRDMYLKETYQ